MGQCSTEQNTVHPHMCIAVHWSPGVLVYTVYVLWSAIQINSDSLQCPYKLPFLISLLAYYAYALYFQLQAHGNTGAIQCVECNYFPGTCLSHVQFSFEMNKKEWLCMVMFPGLHKASTRQCTYVQVYIVCIWSIHLCAFRCITQPPAHNCIQSDLLNHLNGCLYKAAGPWACTLHGHVNKAFDSLTSHKFADQKFWLHLLHT